MNDTIVNAVISSEYDHNGAIIYTIVTLIFYSLSLFCSLILNIDPDDHYYEKKWSVYQNGKNKRPFHSSQTDILNSLSDPLLRQKYWRIYYENNQFECESDKFVSAELKRLSNVSQRMKEISNERLKQSSKHKELDELNRITTHNLPQPSPSPSPTFFFKFRRARSTSVPGVSYSDYSIHQSFDVLCDTPLCKPPTITHTNYS